MPGYEGQTSDAENKRSRSPTVVRRDDDVRRGQMGNVNSEAQEPREGRIQGQVRDERPSRMS